MIEKQLYKLSIKAQEEHYLLSSFIRDSKQFQKDLLKREGELLQKFDDLPKELPDDFILKVNVGDDNTKKSYELDKAMTEIIVGVMTKKNQMTFKYENLIHIMTFIYSTAIFDALLIDLLKEILIQNENSMKSNKTLTIQKILEHNNFESLKEHILNKELLEFGFKSFKDQQKYFVDKFNFDFANSIEIFDGASEIIETRNVHVHNRGVINSIYLENIKKTDFKFGDYRQIDEDYLEKSRDNLHYTINVLIEQSLEKFA